MQRHRIGIIGCGAVADFGHGHAILRVPELEFAACYDPDLARAMAYAAKFGVGFATDDLDAFYQQELEAICVASPMPTHDEHVLRAAAESVHVLCEKPIAETESQALAMEAAMQKAGKGFFVGFVYRFSHVSWQLRQWVREGKIGELKVIRMVYNWNLHGQWVQDSAGKWIESPTWRGRMLEGGPMIDCGVHFIDLCRWITGAEIESASAVGARVEDEYEAPSHAWLHLKLQNGVQAHIEVAFSYTHTAKEPLSIFTYELIGTGGVARFDRNGYLLEVRTGEGTFAGHGTSEKDFDGMWRAFAHYLRTGESGDLASAEDARIATHWAQTPV